MASRVNFRFTFPSSLNNSVLQANSPSNLRTTTSSIASSALSSLSSSSVFIPRKLSCFEWLFNYIFDTTSKIHFFFHSFFYKTITPSASHAELLKAYNGLGADKWKECIDGRYHHLGKDVFKQGVHGGCIEPEYVPSMEKAFEFCAKYLNKKVDADWYLQLHKITCGHFNGDPAVYLMGQEKVGVFRGTGDHVAWWPPGGTYYTVTPEAKNELETLDAEIKREFGSGYGMGKMEIDSYYNAMKHSYHEMSRSQVRTVFTKFLNDFYAEIETVTNPDQKLTIIAKLYKRLELLHPPRDGSGRTNTAFMNKILTDYGFHPAILDYPYVSTTYGLARWTEYLKEGLRKWEAERARLHA